MQDPEEASHFRSNAGDFAPLCTCTAQVQSTPLQRHRLLKGILGEDCGQARSLFTPSRALLPYSQPAVPSSA